ncbi:hypothetical protein [Geodermatophilus sp. URMC 65]
MELLLWIVVVLFWAGPLIGLPVLYFRSGLGRVKREEGIDWREFLLPNLGFFLLMLAKALLWPFTVAVWNSRGRPASPWTAVTIRNGRPARAIVRSEELDDPLAGRR